MGMNFKRMLMSFWRLLVWLCVCQFVYMFVCEFGTRPSSRQEIKVCKSYSFFVFFFFVEMLFVQRSLGGVALA